MFEGLGPMEILLILVILLIVFGAGKLPEIGGAIGKSIREFRQARDGEYDKDKDTNVPKSIETRPVVRS